MVMKQADLYEAKCYFRSLRYSKAANLADSGDVHRIWKHIPNVFLNCNICKTVAQLVEQGDYNPRRRFKSDLLLCSRKSDWF